MVEQEAVNFKVAGSSPARGAEIDEQEQNLLFFLFSKSLISYSKTVSIFLCFARSGLDFLDK